ncbi:MAG: peptidylprolyl isomerase [Candidatus Edwardsbacteria bacterium]|jgi:parvulin-like peptidyl-prolyl isomerase|nr:peptidylprolyl isomerase [Candidatus Edwardsbacteria bacterium]
MNRTALPTVLLAALFLTGLPLHAQKKTAKAPAAANEALLATTASLNFKYGDYAEAIANYEKALQQFAASAMVKEYTYQLAMAYERSGNTQKAAELFQDVVTKFKGRIAATADIDSMAMEGVGRCFNKNFQEYEAFINGQPLTKLELDAELEKVPGMYRSQFEGPEGRKKFLDRYVERALLFAEAKRLNPEADPQFNQKLQDARQDQYIRYLIDKEVSAKAQPSDAELKERYRKNIEEYRTKEQVKARQITVATRAEAEQLLKDLKKAKFDSLARARSSDNYAKNGGDMGLVNRGQIPALDTVLFLRTKKGQLSKVTPLDLRYAIVKLEGKDKDKLHLRWIVLSSAADASRLSAALAADPASFDSLAKSSSVDPSRDKAGDLGFVTKGQIDEGVYRAAAKLKKPGDITKAPVAFPTKFAVFKVEDRIAAGIKPFDQVKQQISSGMFSEKQKANYEALLQRVKAAAKIEYPKTEEPVPQPADEKK